GTAEGGTSAANALSTARVSRSRIDGYSTPKDSAKASAVAAESRVLTPTKTASPAKRSESSCSSSASSRHGGQPAHPKLSTTTSPASSALPSCSPVSVVPENSTGSARSSGASCTIVPSPET